MEFTKYLNIDDLIKCYENPELKKYVADEIKRCQNLNWNFISKYQKLPEDFIRDFQAKVYWGLI